MPIAPASCSKPGRLAGAGLWFGGVGRGSVSKISAEVASNLAGTRFPTKRAVQVVGELVESRNLD